MVRDKIGFVGVNYGKQIDATWLVDTIHNCSASDQKPFDFA